MDHKNTYFVGYPTLEGLLSTHERGLPLYMTSLVEVRPSGQPDVMYRCTYIVVSDVQYGVSRYWRYRVGRTTEVAGQLLDPATAARQQADSERKEAQLRRAIRDTFDLTTEAGVVSYPNDMAMLRGETGLLSDDVRGEHYIDTVRTSWCRCEGPPASR